MDNIFALNYIIIPYLAINLIAFLVMLDDKIKSRLTQHERISEGQLFFLATIFGAIGVYVGMFIFHHKTKKWYFLLGIPFLILQNLSLIYCFYYVLLANF